MMGGGKRKLGGGEGDDDGAADTPSTPKSFKTSTNMGGVGLPQASDAAAEDDNGVKVNGNGGVNRNLPSISSGVEVEASPSGDWKVQHPLLNEVVLRNLFKYVSMDLKLLGPSQAVCRKWRNTFLKPWRASATPKIVYSYDGPNYGMNGKSETPLADFLKFWEEEFPGNGNDADANNLFRQFHLEGWTICEEDDINPDARRFWKLVGAHISKLKLDDCKASRSGEFVRVINHSLPNLGTLSISNSQLNECDPVSWDEDEYKEPVHGEHPNLKSLELIYPQTSRGNAIQHQLGMTYLELLSHFPNVASLKMVSKVLSIELPDFLRAVRTIRRQDAGKLPITQLVTGPGHRVSFWYQMRDGVPRGMVEIIELLQQLNITLESVQLTGGMNPLAMRHALEFNNGTLRVLDVWIPCVTFPACHFPFGVQLPNLEELSMPERFCKTLDFIKYTPKLRNLRIWTDAAGLLEGLLKRDTNSKVTTLISNASKSELTNTQLLKLTTLKLENFTMSEKDLRWLVKWMPHVKEVTMELDNKLFPIVCQNWKSLVTLQVMGHGLTDEGVTGEEGMCMWMQGRMGSSASETCPGPGVAALQNLEVFVSPNARLTEASLFHGLLKIGSLRQIYFCNCEHLGDTATRELVWRNVKIGSEF